MPAFTLYCLHWLIMLECFFGETGGYFGCVFLSLHREILGSESSWQYLLASNAVPGFFQLLTLPWFPESPRYLLIDRGDKEACFAGKKFPHRLDRFRAGGEPKQYLLGQIFPLKGFMF